jgi:hypothetical protein
MKETNAFQFTTNDTLHSFVLQVFINSIAFAKKITNHEWKTNKTKITTKIKTKHNAKIKNARTHFLMAYNFHAILFWHESFSMQVIPTPFLILLDIIFSFNKVKSKVRTSTINYSWLRPTRAIINQNYTWFNNALVFPLLDQTRDMLDQLLNATFQHNKIKP